MPRINQATQAQEWAREAFRLKDINTDLLEALRNCRSLVELKFGNTDPTGNAAIAQADDAIKAATEG